MIDQTFLYIPSDIQARIDTAELFKIGSVVRDTATGRVFKHLDEVPGPAKDQVERAVANLRVGLRRPWVVIAVATVGAAAMGGATLIAARRRKRAGKPEIRESLKNFNASLRTYLEAAREGRLDAGIVSQLISDLDAVQAHSGDAVITVGLSIEQWKTLVNAVADYTRKLAEANSIELDEVPEQADPENDTVVDLRRYLEAQRKIFTKRAA